MESLEIPHIAEQTIYDDSFSTPFLEDITHGQRDNLTKIYRLICFTLIVKLLLFYPFKIIFLNRLSLYEAYIFSEI
jgi:hypothetical protein